MVEFKYNKLPDNTNMATVVFYETETGEDKSFEQTNKHKYAFALFATVSEIIKNTTPSWSVLSFASDTARVGLYTALVKRLAYDKKVYNSNSTRGGLWVICKQPIPPNDLKLIKQYAEQFISTK